jgi:hypothetical protein
MSEKESTKRWDYSILVNIIVIVTVAFTAFFFIDNRYAKKDRTQEQNREFVLIPASKLWEETSIVVRPHEKVHIKASGLVNTAIHRLVFNAMDYQKPNIEWNGPEGVLDLPISKPMYLKRRQALILPTANYGALLMYPVKHGGTAPSKYNAFPTGIQVVNTDMVYTNETDEDVTLYFVVNDTVFKSDPDFKSVFVGTQEELDMTYGKGKETVAKREKSYNKILAQSYWEIWFDNNAGEFLVEVEHID